MPAKDLHHNQLKAALIKDGWTITDDPLHIPFGKTDLYVDLGAERLLSAIKGDEKIAAELKSFVGDSTVHDLHLAIGQFFVYLLGLRHKEPDRVLYLAVNEETYEDVFEESLGRALIEEYKLPMIVFDSDKEVIIRWITWNKHEN
jgi:XisH protein